MTKAKTTANPFKVGDVVVPSDRYYAVQAANNFLFWDTKTNHLCSPYWNCQGRRGHGYEESEENPDVVEVHSVIEVVEIERVTTTRIEVVITNEPVLDRLAAI